MSVKQPGLTPEQYLELDRASEFRNEYYNGCMHAMWGGTYNHGLVIGNLAYGLRKSFGGPPCAVVTSDLRIRVTPGGVYTYPDIVVVCGEPQYVDNRRDTVLNPVLLIEVLSPGTEAYDRGFKFAQYRTLESLQEYALVSQTEPRVEVFRRQATGQWLLSEFAGLDAVCRFESVDTGLAMAEVYENVTFGGEEPSAAG